jgi:amino acid transporter
MAVAQRPRPQREEGAAPGLIKRIFVGRSMASGRMEHTLLPKVLALPIFASDALSSVAYCVEASLLILLTASANVRGLIIPINLAVALVMAVVITSYKQVVRAYPTSAGSYVVSKENLATIFGLIAGAALLADYVLTVAVSVSAGMIAVVSAAQGLHPYLVPMSIGCVILLMLANLRGVRESGLLFAVPTYGFIASMFALIVVGVTKCLTNCPQAAPPPDPIAVGTAASASLFVILHSFSSGSSALTGTEAISNGVSAFRRPQGRNASQTLTSLGVIAVLMITGTAYLAWRTNPTPSASGKISVVAEMAKTIFPGSSGSGGPMFYVIQAFTLLILVLAANTSFQGFPRLSALLARDRWIPRQFENLGDRLVYSNGMFVLAGLAIALIVIYEANVDKLLQLYVVGVFTAFTLSQTGMVRYWLRTAKEGGAKAEGWHWRLAINAVGAIATGLVLVIVVITKFTEGAWIVITAIPLMILLFYAVHRHYAAVRQQLRLSGVPRVREAPRNHVVVVVEHIDRSLAEAIGYVRSFAGDEFRAVHARSGEDPADLQDRWASFSRTAVRLEVLEPTGGDAVRAVLAYVHAIPRAPGDFVTVVVPEQLTKRSLLAAVRRRQSFRLKLRLLAEPQIAVCDVPVLIEPVEGDEAAPAHPRIPRRTEALVFVSSANDASLRAINYARSLRATEARAVFFAMEPEEATEIQREWEEFSISLPLDIIEAPFREMDVPVLDELRRITRRPDSLAIVIVPEFRVRKWRHQLLHNQRALFIKRLLLFEPRVILTSVPYQLD